MARQRRGGNAATGRQDVCRTGYSDAGSNGNGNGTGKSKGACACARRLRLRRRGRWTCAAPMAKPVARTRTRLPIRSARKRGGELRVCRSTTPDRPVPRACALRVLREGVKARATRFEPKRSRPMLPAGSRLRARVVLAYSARLRVQTSSEADQPDTASAAVRACTAMARHIRWSASLIWRAVSGSSPGSAPIARSMACAHCAAVCPVTFSWR